jgi:hypothetical protein
VPYKGEDAQNPLNYPLFARRFLYMLPLTESEERITIGNKKGGDPT